LAAALAQVVPIAGHPFVDGLVDARGFGLVEGFEPDADDLARVHVLEIELNPDLKEVADRGRPLVEVRGDGEGSPLLRRGNAPGGK